MVGRTSLPRLSSGTVAESDAIAECTNREARSLSNVCRHSPSNFERHARDTLSNCAFSATGTAVGKREGFLKNMCEARIVRFKKDSLVLICSCRQRQSVKQIYQIVLGRSQFTIQLNRAAAPREVELLYQCTLRSLESLQKVCEGPSKDFSLLGLHVMEACCKDIRATINEKFQCEEVVQEFFNVEGST